MLHPVCQYEDAFQSFLFMIKPFQIMSSSLHGDVFKKPVMKFKNATALI